MSYSADELYRLLPAIYRIRDAERGAPLRALVAVLAEQATVLENDIARLYDNWFIETCEEWVVPYIGDLLGVGGLYPVSEATFSHRARVANTLAYRRRKGTASMLEQLARDTTGWPARVVELFQRLGTTQYMNHVRLANVRAPDLRKTDALNLVGTPFDSTTRTADVRHIDNQRGFYNIQNVGIFLFRLQAYPVFDAPPFPHGGGRFSFSQLGQDAPLFNHPVTETSFSQMAGEINVPAPIRRRALLQSPGSTAPPYYGGERSLFIRVNGIPRDIDACNLTDWQRRPTPGKVAVDPELGRLAFAEGEAPAPSDVRVSYYYGFSGEVGAGCYERDLSPGTPTYGVGDAASFPSITAALERWVADGRPRAIVEIRDNRIYRETLGLAIPAGISLEIRAADRRRPVIELAAAWSVKGEAPGSGNGGALTLDGLLVTGHRIEVEDGGLGALSLSHCTLVPGWALDEAGEPRSPGEASLAIAGNPHLRVSFVRTITGGVNLPGIERLDVSDSLVDGTGGPAIRATTLQMAASTVLGAVSVRVIAEASESIFTGDVRTERIQDGCVRFCFVSPDSVVPRRFACPSASPPRFTSTRYGQPGYGQLRADTAPEILTGAEDEAEMGVFHHLQQAQRDTNLRASLGEYLRVGLEAGIFYVT